MSTRISAKHVITIIPFIGLMLTGFIAGFASSSLGIGGGLILMPVFLLVFRYTPPMAAGTSLATMVPMATVGLGTHFFLQQTDIQWQAIILMMRPDFPKSFMK